MNILDALISIIGAFSLTIYGTKLVGKSLQKVTHKTIGHFFEIVGDSRIMAIFTGFFVTNLVQSSLDVTTMVFSFVNSGLLQLSQALGVIIGADIGATLAGWVVSIFVLNNESLSSYILVFMAFGLIFILFQKNKGLNTFGEFVFGTGFSLLGLTLLLLHLKRYVNFFSRFGFEFVGFSYFSLLIFFVGVFVSFVLRSSGPGIIITLTFLFADYFSLDQAMVIVLGLNLGVVIRPLVSGLRMGGILTRQVVLLYASLKLLGILFGLIFFKFVHGYFNNFFQPYFGSVLSLALYDTTLNFLTLILFFPLNLIFDRFGIDIFIKKVDLFKTGRRYCLKYDRIVVKEVPELALAMAKKEIVSMTDLVEEMAHDYQILFNNPDEKLRKIVDGIRAKEERTDEMYIEITRFLVESSNSNLLLVHHENVNFFVRIVKELESAGDCISRLAKLCRHSYKHRIEYRKESQQELKNYFNLALDFFKSIKNKLSLSIQTEDFDQITYMENCMNQERTRLRSEAQKNLEKGLVNVRAEIMFMDHVRHIERLGDCCMNLAEAIRHLK